MSVRASEAHMSVQQLLRTCTDDVQIERCLVVHESFTRSLDIYASLGGHHVKCNGASGTSLLDTDIPLVEAMSISDMTGNARQPIDSSAAHAAAGAAGSSNRREWEPWVGESVTEKDPHKRMTTDELVALLAANSIPDSSPGSSRFAAPSAPSFTPSQFGSVPAAAAGGGSGKKVKEEEEGDLKLVLSQYGLDETVEALLRENGVKNARDVLIIDDSDAVSMGLKLVDRKKLTKLRADLQRAEAACSARNDAGGRGGA